jgi:hypothetical protein
MKKINFLKTIMGCFLVLFISCTNLDQQVLDGVVVSETGSDVIDPAAQLVSAYEGLRTLQAERDASGIEELVSDAMVGPTRGGDWDDNGVLRQLYLHTWSPLHQFLRDSWNNLLSGVFAANLVLENNPSADQAAQARFIRAYLYYYVVDMYGQMPFRELGSRVEDDAQVMQRAEATQFLIDEVEEIISSLPDLSDPTVANKDAARFLLAKLYLNKAVFTASNPAGPYTFDPTDMNAVIANVDAMTASLAPDYWDNFVPDNSEISPEIIFASKNIQGVSGGNLRAVWFKSNHYNQTPGGWNGFTTLAEYYDKFDPNDHRILYWEPEVLDKSGYNLGFQIGQQYGPGGPGVGEALKDRPGNPLVFTKETQLLAGGATLETSGIRGLKYKPDYVDLNKPDNDYVLARYSDALLMKAEAILRGGSSGDSPTDIVNQIRTRAGQPTLGNVTLEALLDVRARELWWEGWRRNDQIRFETFLEPKELKNSSSEPEKVLFPIPAGALSNPNLTQNPGY